MTAKGSGESDSQLHQLQMAAGLATETGQGYSHHQYARPVGSSAQTKLGFTELYH